ncbi:MAG: nuclear transport factor 2 family protein [Alphaproteobacteria bacterium]|nr:nuclear transport factor 2 family protein [Alphaproteobacteria bacterium]MBL6938375.1 nuclear transport factor 2 family protein [Alphaproteobacteria bacterium]MBL7096434.1 nuclear transport factor 2 family protein [Alphaproteobacteria bacterium]
MSRRIEIARAYLKALEDNVSPDAFFTPDIEQIEFPNRLNPNGGKSDLAEMRARAERGRGMVGQQNYGVQRTYEQGETVILEVAWSATFNIAIGSLKPGEPMKAHFAVFLDFEGDRIRRQRNYDCFEPF